MDFFTLRNATILALTQAGVVVAGVLAAGAAFKWFVTLEMTPPRAMVFVTEWGFAALLLPLAWIALAVRALRRDDENGRGLVALTGPLLLAVLIGAAWHTAVRPWLRLFGCGFSLSAG